MANMTRTSEDFRGTERFELRRRLGAGGMGVVYEAYDRARDRTVALKTLMRAAANDLYRFKREFRALADVAHPNLVSLFELMSDGTSWFFTMELVRGVNFLAYVREQLDDAIGQATHELPTLNVADHQTLSLLDLDDSARLANERDQSIDSALLSEQVATTCNLSRLRSALRQLAEGINVLHETNQLHRDIKPTNVLVTPEGRVVLLDFGLITETSAPELRERRGLAGTPAYMSPEQVAGQPITKASDWYSVGVILYEALTGRLPFTGTVLEVFERKQQMEPPPPSVLVPSVPEDLDALCRDLLRREPQQRPNGLEVLARLSADYLVSESSIQTDTPITAQTFSADTDELFVGREREL